LPTCEDQRQQHLDFLDRDEAELLEAATATKAAGCSVVAGSAGGEGAGCRDKGRRHGDKSGRFA